MTRLLSSIIKYENIICGCLDQVVKSISTPCQQVRLYAATAPAKCKENLSAQERDIGQYRSGRKTIINTLETLFQLKTFEAFSIVANHDCLSKVSPSHIRHNYELLRRNGINHETILESPEVLAEPTLESKIKVLQKSPYELSEVINLIPLPEKRLEHFTASNTGASKIEALSQALKISYKETCKLFAQRPFLCNLSSETLVNKVKILQEFGITSEDICNDLWVLRYSTELIKTRLSKAQEEKVSAMKTWMVRAEPRIFQHYVKRRSDNRSILGENSLSEYLSNRLQCSMLVANYLIEKQPALKNKSLKRLNDLIDFLYSAGFTASQICRVPKILVHSVKTTRNRVKQMTDENLKVDSLHMLTKSKKQFNEYYEALLKSSKNKTKSP